jgi:hypothetical protein
MPIRTCMGGLIRFPTLTLLLGGALGAGLGYAPVVLAELRTGQVAQLGAQRVLIDVTNGGVSTDGYFIFIEGIPGPFFRAGGATDETTAFFAFRTDPPAGPPLPQTPNGLTMTTAPILAGGTYSIYYNPDPPARDFNNIADFGTGQLVARFERFAGLYVADQGATGGYIFSAKLIWSTDFVVNGKTVNFRELTPHGVTTVGTVSHTSLFSFPLVSQPAAFSAVAMGSADQE